MQASKELGSDNICMSNRHSSDRGKPRFSCPADKNSLTALGNGIKKSTKNSREGESLWELYVSRVIHDTSPEMTGISRAMRCKKSLYEQSEL